MHKIINKISKLITVDRVLITLLIIFCLLLMLNHFSFKVIAIDNMIDGSWVYSLSNLKHSNQLLSRDINFTYGPLFGLLTTYVTPKDQFVDFVINLSIFSTILAGFITSTMSVYQYIKSKYHKIGFVVIIFALTLLTVNIDTLFLIFLLFSVISILSSKNIYLKVLVAFSVTFFSFYKLSYMFPTLLLIPLSLVLVKNSRLILQKTVLNIVIYYFTFILTFLILTRSDFIHLYNYMYIGLINSAFYGEYMSLPYWFNKNYVVSFMITEVIFISIILILFVRKFIQKQLNYNILLTNFSLILLSFLALKMSIVRSDGHLFIYIPFIVLMFWYLFGALFRINSKNNITLSIISLFIGVAFFIALSYSNGLGHKQYFVKNLRSIAVSVYKNPYNYFGFIKTRKYITDLTYGYPHYKTSFTEQYKKFNDNNEILFYGNTSIVGDVINKNKPVTHAPFLQNYAAFPANFFNDKYIDKFSSNKSGFVFLDESFSSIDNRIPTFDLGEFFQYIRLNYKVVLADRPSRRFLLERQSNKKINCVVLKSIKSSTGEVVTIPADPINHSSEFINMRIEVEETPLDKFLSVIIKKPTYEIILYKKVNEKIVYRAIPDGLKNGVSINPFYLTYSDYFDNNDLPINQISLINENHSRRTLNIHFEKCGLN